LSEVHWEGCRLGGRRCELLLSRRIHVHVLEQVVGCWLLEEGLRRGCRSHIHEIEEISIVASCCDNDWLLMRCRFKQI
jgi:hypothetical protein